MVDTRQVRLLFLAACLSLAVGFLTTTSPVGATAHGRLNPEERLTVALPRQRDAHGQFSECAIVPARSGFCFCGSGYAQALVSSKGTRGLGRVHREVSRSNLHPFSNTISTEHRLHRFVAGTFFFS